MNDIDSRRTSQQARQLRKGLVSVKLEQMTTNKRCKVAVIGTINRDTVIRADGSKIEGYGGILYNLAVLSRLLGDRGTIFPVANIGADHEREIRGLLGRFANCELSALATVRAANNHCLLTYQSVSEKTEILSGWVGGVSREKLRTILDSDFILVNFISGSDISTTNLKWLRANTRAVIYIDFHSRTLGRKRDGARFLRRPRDWAETVACADILQMNEVEFELLAGVKPSRQECEKFARKYLARSARGLLVTLGADGVILAERKRGAVTARQIPAAQLRRVVDTTGCGDIFAGAFVAACALGHGLRSSAETAVGAASARAGVSGIEQVRWDKVTAKSTG